MRISGALIILFLNLWVADAVRAEVTNSCTGSTKSVDLRLQMPPMRDQGSVGWCYGFTAADLLTHYLYKTKGKTISENRPEANYLTKEYSVSAMGVSTAHNVVQRSSYPKSISGKTLAQLTSLRRKVFAESGTVSDALKAAVDKGICFERDVSSEDFGYLKDYKCAVQNHCEISDILALIYDTSKDNPSCQQLSNIQKVFSRLDLDMIKKILIESARENAAANLVNASCKKQFTTFFGISRGPKIETLTAELNSQKSKLLTFLDDRLDSGMPVGIMYTADFLTSEGNSKTFNHASTIIGKRFNSKTCEVEYILRNSWGSGCANYTKDNPKFSPCMNSLKIYLNAKVGDKKAAQDYFDGLISCRKNNPPLPRNPRVVCDDSNGHVIVRKSDLEKNIYNVTALK